MMNKIYLWVIGAVLLICIADSFGNTCEKHPIFCHILEISPRINKKLAFRISNKIAKYSHKYKLDARLFTAIIRQESNFKLNAKGCHVGLDEFLVETKVCADFGIGQIYYKTAKAYKFEIDKILTDLDYSIDAAAKVLYNFKKRYAKKDADYWLRYNCGNRSTTKRTTCRFYKKLVERYL